MITGRAKDCKDLRKPESEIAYKAIKWRFHWRSSVRSKTSFHRTGTNSMKVSNPVNAIASTFMTGSAIVTSLLLLMFRSISRIMVRASRGINLIRRLEVFQFLRTSPTLINRITVAATGHQTEESTIKRQATVPIRGA